MKTVLQPIPLINRLCGLQKLKADTVYRPATHCLTVPCDDGMLLYHTLTGELMLLTHQEWERRESKPIREELVRHRFLVPEDCDERHYSDQVLTTLRAIQPGEERIKSFTVFTTMDCNARCFYCYELGRPRPSMEDNVALAAADYIQKAGGGQEVSIQWFGGEPLFNRRVIDLITQKLNENNVPFHSKIITNGWLFDKEIIEHAKTDWHLTMAQISLDGLEQSYNRAKAYVDRSESGFARVMNNIGMLLVHGIRVQIRLNMNDQNAQELLQLAELLHDRFSGKTGLSVYPAVLMSFTGYSVGVGDAESCTFENYKALSEKLLELGLRRRRKLTAAVKLYGCMADDPSAVTILPDGRIGKCEHESENNMIGSIFSSAIDRRMTQAWQERLNSQTCDACAIYPLCRQLKKCEWNKNGCTALMQKIRMYSLHQKILNTFRLEADCGQA